MVGRWISQFGPTVSEDPRPDAHELTGKGSAQTCDGTDALLRIAQRPWQRLPDGRILVRRKAPVRGSWATPGLVAIVTMRLGPPSPCIAHSDAICWIPARSSCSFSTYTLGEASSDLLRRQRHCMHPVERVVLHLAAVHRPAACELPTWAGRYQHTGTPHSNCAQHFCANRAWRR